MKFGPTVLDGLDRQRLIVAPHFHPTRVERLGVPPHVNHEREFLTRTYGLRQLFDANFDDRRDVDRRAGFGKLTRRAGDQRDFELQGPSRRQVFGCYGE
jgi:hypothetical protein